MAQTNNDYFMATSNDKQQVSSRENSLTMLYHSDYCQKSDMFRSVAVAPQNPLSTHAYCHNPPLPLSLCFSLTDSPILYWAESRE